MPSGARAVGSDMMIEVWSDVVCPWCLVGKRRLEAALAQFEHADGVTIRWRSFQLDPAAEVSDPDMAGDHAGHLGEKYGGGREAGLAMIEQMTHVAAQDGLEFRLDRATGRNTGDAHRLLHAAAAADDGYALQGRLKEALLQAYMRDGERIDDRSVLTRLAVDAGLDADVVRQVLTGDLYAGDVAADQAAAAAMGASGVPFVVLDRRYGVSGAQPVEVFAQALRQAWAERSPITVLSGADGDPSCGPDGCTV